MNLNNPEMIGRIIDGRYRLDAKIGVGGMGAVYRATRLLIGDEVAIKILHHDQASLPNSAERFRREAQAAARLKHPNAVSIYDFGISADGLQYLVMELMEGRSLRDIVNQEGALTVSTAVEIVTQVCAALDEAHRQNIIHRDIKPDNIVINETSYGLRVKVLDFGIAKLRDQQVSHLTQTGSVVGTPHYMSPEHCMGEELDGRSDVYSLGIVIYEMLCGAVPFNSPISTAVVVQQVNQPPPSLRAKNPGITVEVEAVVLHALEKRREARPLSAGTLAQELAVAESGAAVFLPAFQSGAGMETTIPIPAGFSAAADLTPTIHITKTPKLGEIAPETRVKKNLLLIVVSALLTVGIVIVAMTLFLPSRGKDQMKAETSTSPLTDTENSRSPATQNFDKVFAGLVSDKFKIEMKLKREGGNLSGSYFYQPAHYIERYGNLTEEPQLWADKDGSLIRIDIPVKGTVDEQENISIEEFDVNGKQTGIFKGRFISATEMEGNWSKPNGKNPMPFSLKEDANLTGAGRYTIVSKQIKRKTKKTELEISYPQLQDPSDGNTQVKLNEKIQGLINKDLSEFKDYEGTHNLGFSISQRSPSLLSVIFGVYNEWPMAAHGQHYNFSFNYDLKNDREIKLGDLFNPRANYLSVVSELCAREIAKQKKKNGIEDIYEDGVATAFEALKEDTTFYPAEKGLVIIFDPYQVGSYAEGYYVVLIPYPALKSVINTNGPLAAFIN